MIVIEGQVAPDASLRLWMHIMAITHGPFRKISLRLTY